MTPFWLNPLRTRAVPLALLASLVGCASLQSGVNASMDPDTQTPEVQAQTQVIDARSAEIPMQSTAGAQFHIMAGELAASRGEPAVAAAELLKALEVVSDAQLATRATGLALAAQDKDLARRAAARWLEIEPTSLDAREVLLRLGLINNDRAGVEEQAQAIIRDHAEGPDEGYRHVALLISQGASDPDLAMSIMEDLLAQSPDLAAAHYALGITALRFGHIERAEQAAQDAARLAPDAMEYQLLLTGVLVRAKKLDEADRQFEHLLKAGPADTDDLRLSYTKMLLEAGERDAARQQLLKVIAGNPENAHARYALGVIAMNDGELETARKLFQGVVSDPDQGKDAQYQLGRIAELQGKYTEALQHYEQVTSGNLIVEGVVRRAAVLAKLNRIPEALELMERVRQQFPPLAERMIGVEGEILMDAGRNDDALSLYNEAIAENPESSELRYARSLAFERLDRIDDAEADLRAVLANQPGDPTALNALGYMLTVHTQRYQEALDLISEAYAQMPDDPAVIDSMGWVKFKLGQTGEALHLLQRAYDLSGDAEIGAHLGEVLWTAGEQQRAQAIWQESLRRAPGHDLIRETMQRLVP